MNLIEQAERDLDFVLEDKDSGFGVTVVLIDPDQFQYTIIGQSTDIALMIDPDTGALVRGRTAEITLRLSSVLSACGTIPDKSEDGTGWILQYENINGDEWTFSIGSAEVDRKIGVVKFTLELLDVG